MPEELARLCRYYLRRPSVNSFYFCFTRNRKNSILFWIFIKVFYWISLDVSIHVCSLNVVATRYWATYILFWNSVKETVSSYAGYNAYTNAFFSTSLNSHLPHPNSCSRSLTASLPPASPPVACCCLLSKNFSALLMFTFDWASVLLTR